MKIHWIKISGITFIFSLVFHLSIIFGILAKLIDTKGFYANFVFAGWLLYLYPLTIITSSFCAALLIKENKMRHFFFALFMSLIINFLLFNLVSMYGRIKNDAAMQRMYIKEPQSRAIFDQKRPLSIIDPLVIKENALSPINIVVYALPGVLESGKSRVEIKSDIYPKNSKIWGEGILYLSDKKAKDGRLIYKATINFVPDKNRDSGIIIVKGINGEVATSIIRR